MRKSDFSSAQIVKFALIAIAGSAGAWYSFALAMSGVTRVKVPSLALNYVPNESRALAVSAEQLLFKNPKNPAQHSRDLAIRALENQLVNPSAVRTLGYFADSKGENKKALAFMQTAEGLSRRDAGAQIWLLDYEARSNNAAAALDHYDILLRTNPASQDVLFPQLLAAISDPNIRHALRPFLEDSAGWGNAFLSYATNEGKNLPYIVDLMADSVKKNDSENRHLQKVNLLKILISQKYYNDARRLFITMNGADPARLTSAGFSVTDTAQFYGPMGWEILDVDDAGAQFETENDRIILNAYVNPFTTRTIARKIVYLTPGTYTLTTNASSAENIDGATLRWHVSCSMENGTSTSQQFPISTPVSKVNFSVDRRCNATILDLGISGGQGRDGYGILISRISLN